MDGPNAAAFVAAAAAPAAAAAAGAGTPADVCRVLRLRRIMSRSRALLSRLVLRFMSVLYISQSCLNLQVLRSCGGR